MSKSNTLVVQNVFCFHIFQHSHHVDACVQHVLNPKMLPTKIILAKVAGGVSFVQRSLDAAKPPTVSTTMLVDLHGYDGWPGLAVLQDIALGVGFGNLDGNWMDPSTFCHLEHWPFFAGVSIQTTHMFCQSYPKKRTKGFSVLRQITYLRCILLFVQMHDATRAIKHYGVYYGKQCGYCKSG